MASVDDAREYFERLYLTFKGEIGLRSPNRKQFAAFSLDMAGISPEKPIYRGQTFGDGGLLAWDFGVATSCRESNGRVQHAEERILFHLISNLGDLKHLNDQAQHSLHIFTFYSPCDECIILVDQLLSGLKTTLPCMNTVLGYVEMYVNKEDRKLTSGGEKSLGNIDALYKMQQQFPGFRVIEIPNVVNHYYHIDKLYVED